MNKYFIFLLGALFLFFSVGLISNAQTRKNKSPRNKPTATPTPGSSFSCVDSMILSHTEVFIPCKIGYVPTESCPDKTIINVAVKAFGPDGEEADIKYNVSGGRIIGTGSLVQWDLSDVKKAGVYTLTAEFTDWNNERQTKTETITVRNCDCPNDCTCPTIDVSTSGDVKAGETIEFTAHASDDDVKLYSYDWVVSQGQIVSGQGTPKISVKTSRDMTGTITASVRIGNPEFCDTCRVISSQTATIIE
jgi:hypothetical protein